MPRPTLQQRYVTALEARGCRRDPGARSDRYVTLLHATKDDRRYFVGRAGAVRYGRTVTSSMTLSDRGKAALLAEPAA